MEAAQLMMIIMKILKITMMLLIILSKSREERDIGLFITLVPKVYNNVFLFVGLISWGFLFI